MAKATPPEPDVLRLKQRATDQLNDLMKELLFTVDGTPMATVLMADQTFKNKPLNPSQEFFFERAYVSEKSGKVLFRFRPVDAQIYTHAEFDPKKLDDAMPLFGAQLAEMLEIDHTENIGELVKLMVEMIHQDDINAKAKETVEAKHNYADNPKFGMF